jgi:hypothetical protein
VFYKKYFIELSRRFKTSAFLLQTDTVQRTLSSGGVILGASDGNTTLLVLSPDDLFIFSNFNTGDNYIFKDNGDVVFVNPLFGTSYPVSFPFQIVTGQLCEYSIPSSFL